VAKRREPLERVQDATHLGDPLVRDQRLDLVAGEDSRCAPLGILVTFCGSTPRSTIAGLLSIRSSVTAERNMRCTTEHMANAARRQLALVPQREHDVADVPRPDVGQGHLADARQHVKPEPRLLVRDRLDPAPAPLDPALGVARHRDRPGGQTGGFARRDQRLDLIEQRPRLLLLADLEPAAAAATLAVSVLEGDPQLRSPCVHASHRRPRSTSFRVRVLQPVPTLRDGAEQVARTRSQICRRRRRRRSRGEKPIQVAPSDAIHATGLVTRELAAANPGPHGVRRNIRDLGRAADRQVAAACVVVRGAGSASQLADGELQFLTDDIAHQAPQRTV